MILRVLLTATLIVNPLAEAMATGQSVKPRVPFATAFRPNAAASTRITQSDAQDWIIEGAANRFMGNTARALELFEAARDRLDAEKLPEPYAAQIHMRMNNLVASVGGQKTDHEETPADPESPVPDQPQPADPNQPLPGGGSPFNQPVGQAAPTDTAKPLPGTGGFPNVPDITQIAEGIKLDDIGLPVTKTKKPTDANLLIASNSLVLADLNTLMKDEELRSLMWWISSGRIAFYSKDKNLLQIIQRRVSRNDLNQLDSLRNNFGMGNYTDVSMGPIADLLAWAGIINKDYTAEARGLVQMFDGSSLTEIADTYVSQAIKYGAAYGAGFAMWPTSKKLGPTVGANSGMGGGFAGRFAGAAGSPTVKVFSDSLTTFLLTSKYTFKMAALYGVPLDNIDYQLMGLLILSIAKAGIAKRVSRPTPTKAGVNTALEPVADTLGAMGSSFFKANTAGKGKEFLTKQLDRVLGVSDTSGFPSTGNAGGGSLPPDDPNNPFPGPGPTDPDPKDPKKPRPPTQKPTLKQKIGMYASLLARTGKGAAVGAFYAGVMTAGSKYFFQGMYAENVRLQNKAFLRLLNSKKGFAFLKLLIHSMHLEQERVTPVTKRTHSINYIFNLARAGGICSAADYKMLNDTKSQSRPSIEIRKLRFSCPKTNDTYYYDLLMRELLTFNAVRTKNVARLRASILRDRLKMAQLLLQFQYMDGHQSQEEQDYFEEVTSKILGVTSPEQTHFLNIFEGYIRQAGGMQPNANSVTGYAVRRSKEATRVDFNLSPTPLDAPSQVLAVDWNDTTDLDSTGSFNSRPSPF